MKLVERKACFNSKNEGRLERMWKKKVECEKGLQSKKDQAQKRLEKLEVSFT